MFAGRRITVLLLVAATLAAEARSEPTDCYGDPLPEGAIARMGTVRWRLPGWVETCAFSRDGKIIVAAGGDFLVPSSGNSAIHVFDAATGRPLRQLHHHKKDITRLTFSPDGKMLASGSEDGQLCLTEWPSGKVLWQVPPDLEPVWSLAFAGTGEFLVSGSDKLIRLWDSATGREIRQYRGHKDNVRAIAVSPGRRTIASTDYSTVQLWDSASGRLLHQHKADAHWGQLLAFSPDSKMVAFPLEGSKVALWDAVSGKIVRELCDEQSGPVSAVAFAPDGRIVAVGVGAKGRTGIFSPDHWAVAGVNYIVLWDTTTGKTLRKLPVSNNHRWSIGIPCLAFSPDGSRLAFGENRRLRVWDLHAEREVQSDEECTNLISRVQFSGDNKTLITAAPDRIDALREWEVDSGKQLRTLWRKSLLSAHGFNLSPDHTILTIAEMTEKTLSVHSRNTRTGKELSRAAWPVDHRRIHLAGPMVISPNGKIVINGSLFTSPNLAAGPLFLRDMTTGKVLGKISDDHYSELFSPDSGTLAFLSDERVPNSNGPPERRYIDLYNVAKSRIVRKLPLSAADDVVQSMAISPNNRLLAVARSDSGLSAPPGHWLEVRETATGQKRVAEHESPMPLFAMTFSPDGFLLAAGDSDGVIYLRSVAENKEIRRLKGNCGTIMSLAFSHDGNLLASGNSDSTSLIWDIREAVEAARPHPTDLSRDRLERLWADLGDNDAGRAHRAIWSLAAVRQVIPWLQKHLKPVAPADAEHIARLITDLDSDSFAMREKATRELEEMAEVAESALRKVLAGKPTLELRRRIEPIVKSLDNWPGSSPAALRDLRALEVLEHLGTPAARQLLQKLAEGVPEARLTREAKAALQRLAARQDQ